MTRRVLASVLFLFMTTLALAQEPIDAQRPSAHYFSGLALVDQDGHAVQLYELMKGKTVVINSFFATCTASCPVMTHTLAALQSEFGDRLGKDLVFVSITVDPASDTPEKLKIYADSAKAQKGWYFVTGTKEQVGRALTKIGQAVESRDQHANILIIGNERTGLWKKVFALAKRSEIAAALTSVLNDDGTTPAR